jgi:predicted metal-dependent hydrolase
MTTEEKLDRLREFIEKTSQAVRELKDSVALEAERSRLDLRAVKDSLTVEAYLNACRERQYSQAFLEHQEWLKSLDRRFDSIVTVAENQEKRIAGFDARLDRIAALIERFLQGRGTDGHEAGDDH